MIMFTAAKGSINVMILKIKIRRMKAEKVSEKLPQKPLQVMSG